MVKPQGKCKPALAALALQWELDYEKSKEKGRKSYDKSRYKKDSVDK